jgi:hypothetical protein
MISGGRANLRDADELLLPGESPRSAAKPGWVRFRYSILFKPVVLLLLYLRLLEIQAAMRKVRIVRLGLP